jgi:hypothetical protein
VVAAALDGAALTLFNVFWFTALQREIPSPELCRVSSWDYLGSLALQPVGLALSGPIAVAIGVSTTLYAAAGLFAVLLLAVLATPAVRNFPLTAKASPEGKPRRPLEAPVPALTSGK